MALKHHCVLSLVFLAGISVTLHSLSQMPHLFLPHPLTACTEYLLEHISHFGGSHCSVQLWVGANPTQLKSGLFFFFFKEVVY